MEYSIINSNILDLEADAVVLPANTKLKKGSGVSEALFKEAGSKGVENACKEYITKNGIVHEGDSIPTFGYKLKYKYILHTVVPKWKDGEHDEYARLSMAYQNALNMADMIGCSSIVFPLLSSGNNGFNTKLAFRIADESIKAFEPVNQLSNVILVIYGSAVKMLEELGVPYSKEIKIFGVDPETVREKEATAQRNIEKAKGMMFDALDSLYAFAKSIVTDKDIQAAFYQKAKDIVLDAINGKE